jgi:hypothetical protein
MYFCKKYEHFAKIQKFCTLLEQIFGEIKKILLSAKSNTEGTEESKDGLIRCGTASTWLLKNVWNRV